MPDEALTGQAESPEGLGMMPELRRNLLAGLAIAGLLLPEAVAYAGIAGLAPERAILAALAGALAYGLLGRSRTAIVAPTSSSAAILAATLAAVPAGAGGEAGMATWLVLLTGFFFLGAALFRLGSLTGFISRPVLKGFSFGLAVTIILHQLPELMGLKSAGPDLAAFLADVFTRLPGTHALTLLIGSLSLIALLLLRRYPGVPGPLLVLAAGALLGAALPLADMGVETVGPIHLSLSGSAFAFPGWTQISDLAQYAVPLVLILFAESWGTVRSQSVSPGETLQPNRELGAFGAANLLSGLVGGMPVGAGFSAGEAARAAGMNSRAGGLIAAGGLLALVLFGGALVEGLPRAIPAAVVIAALGHALDLRPFLRLWRLGRDHYLALGTAAGILVLGVLDGMLLAVALSLVALLQRLSHPDIARLGQLAGTRDYVDRSRHPDAVTRFGIGIFRPSAPLFYANAEGVLNEITRLVREDPAVSSVILSLEESFDLDTTALDQLLEFDRTLKQNGYRIEYARVHDHLRELLERAGEMELLGRCHYSVDDAVRTLDAAGMRHPVRD